MASSPGVSDESSPVPKWGSNTLNPPANGWVISNGWPDGFLQVEPDPGAWGDGSSALVKVVARP